MNVYRLTALTHTQTLTVNVLQLQIGLHVWLTRAEAWLELGSEDRVGTLCGPLCFALAKAREFPKSKPKREGAERGEERERETGGKSGSDSVRAK